MQLIKPINHLLNGWVVLLILFSIILTFSTNASYFDIFYNTLYSPENSHCLLGLHFVSIFSSRIIMRLSLNNVYGVLSVVEIQSFEIIQRWKWKVLVAQSCLTLCDPMDCSPPGSSVHGILQARILKWGAIPFSRRSSQTRDWTWVSHIAGRFFSVWEWN